MNMSRTAATVACSEDSNIVGSWRCVEDTTAMQPPFDSAVQDKPGKSNHSGNAHALLPLDRPAWAIFFGISTSRAHVVPVHSLCDRSHCLASSSRWPSPGVNEHATGSAHVVRWIDSQQPILAFKLGHSLHDHFNEALVIVCGCCITWSVLLCMESPGTKSFTSLLRSCFGPNYDVLLAVPLMHSASYQCALFCFYGKAVSRAFCTK